MPVSFKSAHLCDGLETPDKDALATSASSFSLVIDAFKI